MPTPRKAASNVHKPSTRVVDEGVFKQIYDSPQSLPGKHCWVTSDADVRAIERLQMG